MNFQEKIDVVSSINAKDFQVKYLYPQKPVVLKGLTANTIAGERWTLNYFKNTLGNVTVGLFDNSVKKNASSAYTIPDLRMRFGDYLDILAKNEHTNLRIFFFNLFKHKPQLKNEFPCPPLFKTTLDGAGRMFFGGKGTTVRIHYDIDMSNILHTHFQGRKRVVLISPEYSKLLYCLPFNTYSLINIDEPDYKKYPGLNLVKGYDFILEPGDTLFMPSGYWHYMTYLDSGFSISYRGIATTLKSKMAGVINLGVYLPADKLMNKLFGANWLRFKKDVAKRRAESILEEKYLERFMISISHEKPKQNKQNNLWN